MACQNGRRALNPDSSHPENQLSTSLLANEQALLDAIAFSTDDDTPKLVLADYYDEQGQQGKARDMRLWAALRRVVDEPSNDEPRLAYADVCKTYGWHVRAELIEVQCELEQHPRGRAVMEGDYDATDGVGGEWVRAFELMERGRELLRTDHPPIAGIRLRHNQGKTKYNPYGVCGVAGCAMDFCEIERGFVEEVECSAATWLMWADQVCRHWEWCHARHGKESCGICGNRGFYRSPLPATALPIRRVVLTTLPESHVPDVIRQRSWFSAPEWGIDVMESWRAEWPGIEFVLPEGRRPAHRGRPE